MHAATGYALDLRQWSQAERLGRRALAAFAPPHEDAARAERFITPLLARALLQQQQWREAQEVLEAALRRHPNEGSLHRLLALALGGWLELDGGGTVVRYTGLGQPAAAYARYVDEYQPWALDPQRAPRWSLPWYRFHFEAYWFATQAADGGDSTFRERASTLWNIARSVDEFATLRALPGGADLAELFRLHPPRP